MKAKIFVLDTNVILHDAGCIRKFQENDLVVPMAVMEELDKFKKGNDNLAYNARTFVREIDRLTKGRNFGPDGVSLGRGLGSILIEINHPFPKELAKCFADDIPDHRILSTAMWVRDNNPGRFVALVTKDVNLRLKAKAVGMAAQDYLTDKIDEARIEGAKNEISLLCDVPEPVLRELNYGSGEVDWKRVAEEEPAPNKLFRLRWGKGGKAGSGEASTVCARYDAEKHKVVFVKALNVCGISPRNDEQKFAVDACMNPKVSLVSLTGGAGTGKTLIALASALEQEADFDQIVLTRPAVILGNQDIGFLPGDQKTKMNPFVQPLMDNLDVIRNCFRPGSKQAARIDAMLSSEKLYISPLAYIRGRSLGKVFFIIDEAQNLTPHEVKTIITRAGEGTKMVFTGDVFQIDQPYLDMYSNGLTHLGEKLAGQKLFEHVDLRKGERSELSNIAARLL